MKPYFETDLVKLYHGDALEVTEWLAADVLVTDPPYGMAYKSGMDRGTRTKWHEKLKGDDSPEIRDNVLALWPANKAALVFGTWRVLMPENTRQVVIWDKTPCGFMGDLAVPFGPAHEEIYVIGKDGWAGSREPSIIRAKMLMSGDLERPDHPTPKPIGLMEKLISKTTGVIADPFAGSGTTLIAARNLGRQAIGVEIEERYCELITKRLSQEAFSLDVFADN
jgi:site-specific DNA-methyltransferase (adenine-specific)